MTEVKQNRFILSILLSLAAIFPSCKKEINQTVTVEHDCTGTYLRFDGKDYHVCNLEKVASFSDGATARAKFKKIRECNGSARDAIVCAMLHPNEGWIEVRSIE
jgi:hypothetical protein